jgi:hypothetical protein
MLPEKIYKTVADGLDIATNAMKAHGDAELNRDPEDAMIYKRLLQITRRIVKRGKKAQKLKQTQKHGSPIK